MATEYAWVAENSEGQYLARPKEAAFWTYDHVKAIRFRRECDVHAIAPLLIKETGCYSSFYKAVEHGWMDEGPELESASLTKPQAGWQDISTAPKDAFF